MIDIYNFSFLVFIVPLNQNFTPTENTTIESIRVGLKNVVNLAARCSVNRTDSACVQVRKRIKRQICSSGYDTVLQSDLTQVR